MIPLDDVAHLCPFCEWALFVPGEVAAQQGLEALVADIEAWLEDHLAEHVEEMVSP